MCDGRGQKRLQANNQRRKPGRQAMAERHKHAAEIKAVHHQPGRHAVPEAHGVRAFRPRQRDDDAEDQDHVSTCRRARSNAAIAIEKAAVFVAPAVFVLLWSSGFIGAKFGLAYAEPLTYLALRMLGAGLDHAATAR